MFHYLKYFSFHLTGLFAAVTLLAGGGWIVAGLCVVLALYVVGDIVCGDDLSTPYLPASWLLTAQLWLALPLLALIVFVSTWTVCSGDPLGFGAWLTQASGFDVLAARAATSDWQRIAAVWQTALMIGMVGTIPGHELTHRTQDPVSMLVGRWLLAFSFDTAFSVEHVYGHHRYVSTTRDPATAPRGRNVYAHIVLSTMRGNISAWHIEARRLARRGYALFGWHNALLRGYLMSACLLALAWAMGGGRALLYFVLCGLAGKSLLEIVNYMEHYGLVRVPDTRVQPRHSWNSNRRISSWTMFNLTRHSHHHANAGVRYQDLKPFPDAPMMISGYLGTMMLTLVPPLWRRLMAPKLAAWDRDFASDAERALVVSGKAGT